MPDLRDPFDSLRRDLDAAQAPDMLADAYERAPSVGDPAGPPPWRRAGVVALALLIAAASTFFAIRAFDGDRSIPAGPAGVLPYPLAYTGSDVPDPHWTHGELWLMDQSGNRVTLSSIPGDQTAVPAWSPDGSQIAFAAQLDNLGTQIWVINADGTGLHEITRMVPFDASMNPDPGSAINDAPAWSPDGTRIAFNCYNGQGHQVCVANSDGTGSPRMVTDRINVAHDTPPIWLGPNELMFSTDGPPDQGTYTLSLNGGDPTRIGSARRQMTLSPDGNLIAFLCPTGQGYAICTERTDLGDRVQVTSPPTDLASGVSDSDSYPAWLPDGRLSFVRESQAFYGFRLYVVDAQGGTPTQLANVGDDVRGFAWGPPETQIATPSPAPNTTQPSPSETSAVCQTHSHSDPAYVDLSGTEVTKDTLAEPGVPRSEITLLPATALDSFFVAPGMDSAGAPQDGWRPILEEQDRVVIAAPMPDGKTWYYANFTKDNGAWKVAGWGATEPVATAAQRGAGLELQWLAGTTVTRDAPSADILLVNDRPDTWVDDRGEYVAYVHLFDPETGEEVPIGPAGIDGVGREYRLPPGGSVKLSIAFGDLSSVSDGTYQAVACVPQLALASPIGAVTVTSGASISAAPSASVTSLNPSAQPDGTTLGAIHVPGKAMGIAVGYLNSMACDTGRLDRVTTTGATTVAHLAEALPIMSGTTGSASWQSLPADTPIYAAVVRGRCQSHGQPYVQGYVLFDDQGVALFSRVWNKGLEPHLESPFGPKANDGLSI